jgi:hypothetical protein
MNHVFFIVSPPFVAPAEQPLSHLRSGSPRARATPGFKRARQLKWNPV